MNINEALNTIKDDAITEVIEEFKSLLKSAKKDAETLIRQMAEQAERALILRAENKISQEDVITLLKTQKKTAQIFANTAEIALLSRIQKVGYRILDIAIDVLAKAIVL